MAAHTLVYLSAQQLNCLLPKRQHAHVKFELELRSSIMYHRRRIMSMADRNDSSETHAHLR